MKLTEEQKEKLEMIAQGTTGKFLVEYLEQMKLYVADVRTELDVRPEVEKEVRLATVDLIEQLLCSKLRILGNPPEKSLEEYQ
jgi:hypothetical protein